jgi:hypothetical protein
MALATEAEVKIRRRWNTISIVKALSNRDDTYRCTECRCEVRPHKRGCDGRKAHFEHCERYLYCSLSDHSKGKPSRHSTPLS